MHLFLHHPGQEGHQFSSVMGRVASRLQRRRRYKGGFLWDAELWKRPGLENGPQTVVCKTQQHQMPGFDL